ncbi:hypothetical protein HDE_04689 [Halotydeus destructor]|nr:hypothetical protein HDE_04689 [Halotydeus destructor]
MTEPIEGVDCVEEVLEEDYAIIQIDGLFDTNSLKDTASQCKIHKIDEEEPILQIGNQFFKGPLDYTMGTALCFEECGQTSRLTKLNQANVANSNDYKKLKYVVKTDKIFRMKRVFLHPKGSQPVNNEQSS